MLSPPEFLSYYKNMPNKISNMEIEIRGALPNKSCIKRIVAKIQKQGKATIQENRQVVIFYKKNNKDFRIKWDRDKKYFEFVYKTKQGTQRTVRDEFTIAVGKKQISDFFKILEELGLKKGFVSPTYRIDIITPFITWSFKLGSVIGDYWEAEATDQLSRKFKRNASQIKAYLENNARLLNLSFWSEEEFRKLRQKKWGKIQPLENSKIIEVLQNDRY